MYTLYGFGPTRSLRPKWALQELDIRYEYVEGFEHTKTEDYRRIHPLGKLPALKHNDVVIFESVAIVNYLADQFPDRELIPRPGTMERAFHDQWSCFALAELESWLWSTASHQGKYPEDKRVPAIFASNNEEIAKSLSVVEKELKNKPYILGDKFSATDINIAFTLNWARIWDKSEARYPNIDNYLSRLHERPASALPDQTNFSKK